MPAPHLYLWVPNALLPDGLAVMQAWGFQYKANIVWQKVRKDGGPDGRGVGFYFRNVTELLLFGVRGKNARTLSPGRTQVNTIATRKREHSRKPDEQYPLITSCSPGPYLELFARGERPGWASWGDQACSSYAPSWPTYANHSQHERPSSQGAFLTLRLATDLVFRQLLDRAGVERDDRCRQPDEKQRTRVADTARYAIDQLAPMRGCRAELVRHEVVGLRVPQRRPGPSIAPRA